MSTVIQTMRGVLVRVASQLERHLDAWFGGAAMGVLLCAIVTDNLNARGAIILYSVVVLAWIVAAARNILR